MRHPIVAAALLALVIGPGDARAQDDTARLEQVIERLQTENQDLKATLDALRRQSLEDRRRLQAELEQLRIDNNRLQDELLRNARRFDQEKRRLMDEKEALLAELAERRGEGRRAGPPAPAEEAEAAEEGEPEVVTTESGLQYQDLEVGEGASPRAGQTCVVHYTGWLEDGTKFDSSRDRRQPFSFPIARGRVIDGWDEGVASMKVGGKRRLIVPPHLGYGERGAGGVIPPNATLVFEVELIRIE